MEGGGSKFVCGVAREPGHWLERVVIPTRAPESTLAEVADFFLRHRSQGLERIGMACFGPLDLAQGCLHVTPKPLWSHVPLVASLRARIGCDIVLDTDVNAAALAEQRWGAAIAADPVVYVTVGTGIGVGIVVNGKPLHGLLHPELGHLPAPALDSVAGACPFHGRCIEGVAAAGALRARLGMEPAQAPDDSPAWQREGEYLAHLIAAAVLCVSPRRVVVGGGIAARQALWPAMRAGVSEMLGAYLARAELSAEGIERFIVPSALAPDAGLMGALGLALDACA